MSIFQDTINVPIIELEKCPFSKIVASSPIYQSPNELLFSYSLIDLGSYHRIVYLGALQYNCYCWYIDQCIYYYLIIMDSQDDPSQFQDNVCPRSYLWIFMRVSLPQAPIQTNVWPSWHFPPQWKLEKFKDWSPRMVGLFPS